MMDSFTLLFLLVTVFPAIIIYLTGLKYFGWSDEKSSLRSVLIPALLIIIFSLGENFLAPADQQMQIPLLALGVFLILASSILCSCLGWAIAKFAIMRFWK